MPTSFLKVMIYYRKLIFIALRIYKNISGALTCMYVLEMNIWHLRRAEEGIESPWDWSYTRL